MMNPTYRALIAKGLSSHSAKKLSELGTLPKIKKLTNKYLEAVGLTYHEIELLSSKGRKRIPNQILNNVLIKSKFCCALCRDKKAPFIIHHIEEYSVSENNSEDNLIVLCPNCHAKVHSKSEISRNITPDILKDSKARWEEQCRIEDAAYILQLSHTRNSRWDWFNVPRIRELFQQHTEYIKPSRVFEALKTKGFIDYDDFLDMGKIQETAKPSHFTDFGDGTLITSYLGDLLEKIIFDIKPFDLTPFLSNANILKGIIEKDSYIALQGRFYFKDINDGKKKAYYKAHDVKISFIYDPYYCASSSSKYDSMFGNKVITVLGRVIDISYNEDGILCISLSCLVAGSYFKLHHSKSCFYYSSMSPTNSEDFF